MKRGTTRKGIKSYVRTEAHREFSRRLHTTHGQTAGGHSPEYRVWSHMRRRCGDPGHKNYALYGGRGIKVCARWEADFAAFLSDMGPRPRGTSLDRIDTNRGYEPGNCRWATQKEQTRNKRTNRLVTFRGETKCIGEWAEIFSKPYMWLWYRLVKRGWNMERVANG